MLRRGGAIVLILVGAAGITAGAQDSPLVKAAKEARAQGVRSAVYLIGQQAPELAPTRWFNAQPMSLMELRGNVVLLGFWATWCGPCIKAFPDLTNTAQDFRNEEFRIVLLHQPTTYEPGGDRRRQKVPAERVLPSFIMKHSLRFPIVVVSSEDFARYGASGIPLYVVVDKRGVVRYSRSGRMPDRRFLRTLLDE